MENTKYKSVLVICQIILTLWIVGFGGFVCLLTSDIFSSREDNVAISIAMAVPVFVALMIGTLTFFLVEKLRLNGIISSVLLIVGTLAIQWLCYLIASLFGVRI